MSKATSAAAALMQMNQMLVGAWMTQGLHVAAELGIADHLGSGPRTAGELAALTGAHEPSLFRLLRALASVGVFVQDDQQRFALTPLGERLRDEPGSQRAFARLQGAELYHAWSQLHHSVMTGQRGFEKAFGMPFFEYISTKPPRHAIFDQMMTSVHDPETLPMLEAYDFSGFGTVADIGGGNGRLMSELLKRHPKVNGLVFDLPPVAERAKQIMAQEGLNGRCQVVGGSFFESVPAADAYIMRHVLHDWDDASATKILANCRRALRPGGRVLVVETVLANDNEPCFGKWLDLMMLLIGGMERTQQQYQQIMADAGLRLTRVVPTSHEVSVVEAVAAS